MNVPASDHSPQFPKLCPSREAENLINDENEESCRRSSGEQPVWVSVCVFVLESYDTKREREYL